MEVSQYLRAIAALTAVLALMMALLWLLRRTGWGGALGKAGQTRRLSQVESLVLDGRHRLILVRRDDTEHLLLVGGSSEVLVETISPPTAGKENA